MKLKTALVIAAFGSLGLANAAVYNINNVDTGTTETLYANKNNVLSTGGIVTIGVFPAGFNLASSLNDANALITNWTTLASGLTGGPSGSLGGNPAGIAEYDPFDMANITGTDPLLGRLLYSFVGNAATLATSTEYALVQIGLIVDDVPAEQSYSTNPKGLVPIIGTIGSKSGDLLGQGSATFATLKTAVVVPETSTALLGALGALGLLRRRR